MSREITNPSSEEEFRNAIPAISDYALIGDTRSAALISREGSIDWLCWPRFDSRSVFARLLDLERGGHFSIRPAGRFDVHRCYLDGTNVVETTFETKTGRVRLLDLMPALTEERKKTRLLPLRSLIRRLEGIEGRVEMEVDYQPRPDYARGLPGLQLRFEDTVWCAFGPEVWHLRSNVRFQIREPSRATARFTVGAGERRHFALSYETHAPAVFANIDEAADREIDETIGFWRQWASQLAYDGPHREAVMRSALLLKLLTYAPSGAIVAAPTTSLPERIGGIRNWDYRYCWLRDASFTAAALYDCGFEVEGGAFVDWMLYATRLTHPDFQILYDVFGESRLSERELKHLRGYRGSSPVRVGNDAHGQFQLDVYGEVLGAIEEYATRGERLRGDTRRLTRRLADLVSARWSEPDNGIWEKRSGREHHVHGKVLAWAGLDSAERLARAGHLDIDPSRWSRAKQDLRDAILEHGFNRRLGTFVSTFGGDELDASLLQIARVGFLAPDDPRLASTIDAIRRQLGSGDLIYRYTERTDDGLPPGEGAFLACSFWLVEALAITRRLEEATAVFERLLARANDLGLYSEEISVGSGEMVGNFPQALTHIGLMNAALRLQRPLARGQRAAA